MFTIKKNMSTFKQDLNFGQIYEKKALKYFKYDTYKFSVGCCKEYDFEYTRNDRTKYVEVKTDKRAFKTGNICIEFESNKKASGISTTNCDYWVQFVLFPEDDIPGNKIVREDVYKIPIKILKDLVADCKIVGGCENNKNKLFLLRISKIGKYLCKPRRVKTFIDNSIDEITSTMKNTTINDNKNRITK